MGGDERFPRPRLDRRGHTGDHHRFRIPIRHDGDDQGCAASPLSVSGNTALYLTTTAQDTGVAEIVVTGPGQAERFATAFEFAPPQTFDFNGSWEGVYHDNDNIQVVISSNVVARVTCANIDVALPAPLLVNLGAFSATAGNGVEAVSGRIVSDQIAIGEIDTPACRGTWKAFRK